MQQLTAFLACLFLALISACGGGNSEENNVATGLQVVGAHGALQIDGTNPNLALLAQGAASIAAGGSATVTASGIKTPIMCLKSSTPVAVVSQVVSGASITYTLRAASGAAASVSWYLMDAPTYTAGSGAGMQVFSETGTLVFDSAVPVLRVVAAAQVPAGNADTGAPNFAIVASAPGVYAACLTYARVALVDSGTSFTLLQSEGISTSSTGARTHMLTAGIVGSIEEPRWIQPIGGQLLLVDVSAYQ